MTELAFAGYAALGALTEEVLHWGVVRREVDISHAQSLKSPLYWVLVVLVILVSAVGTTILMYEDPPNRKVAYLIGAAFPLVFQKLVRLAKTRATLGNNQKGGAADAIATYFR